MPAAVDRSLPAVFERCVRQRPDAIALVAGARRFTYAELDRLADALAAGLADHGVGEGDVVALSMVRSPALIVAMLAILKRAAAYMPLDGGDPPSRARFCLDRAGVRLIVTDPEREQDCAALCDAGRTSLVASVDALANEPARTARLPSDGETPAYVMFTSGTTSEPKGVVVPHRAVVRLVVDTDYVDIQPHDAILQLSSPSFDASTFEIWGALLNGATLVLYDGAVLDPNRFRRHVAENGITILWLTAALFHLFVANDLDALRPVRTLLAGGDVLHVDAVNRVLDGIDGICLINGYGPTENTTFTCCHRMTRANRPVGNVPIGRPIRGTDVLILDERRLPVATGEIGELYAVGSGVALGYLGRPVGDGPFFRDSLLSDTTIYRTGDLVRADADGVVTFVGRQDSQVKVRGFRVSLEEIQARLMEIPHVREAAVVCQKQDGGDQQLVAFVQADAEHALDVRAIRRHLADRVPSYMIPERISIGTTVPINRNGKLDRKQLFSTIE